MHTDYIQNPPNAEPCEGIGMAARMEELKLELERKGLLTQLGGKEGEGGWDHIMKTLTCHTEALALFYGKQTAPESFKTGKSDG